MQIKITVVYSNIAFDYIINNNMNIREALKIIYDYEKFQFDENSSYIYSHKKQLINSMNFTFEEANIQNGDKISILEVLYD